MILLLGWLTSTTIWGEHPAAGGIQSTLTELLLSLTRVTKYSLVLGRLCQISPLPTSDLNANILQPWRWCATEELLPCGFIYEWKDECYFISLLWRLQRYNFTNFGWELQRNWDFRVDEIVWRSSPAQPGMHVSIAGVLSHLGIPGWTEGSDRSPSALPLGTYVPWAPWTDWLAYSST